MFMSSALTSQRLLTLYGALVLYTNCCSFPYPAPFTISLFITYLVEAIAQNFSLPFQAYLLLTPAYSRVHLSDLYRIYSIHPIWFLVALGIVSINMLTTLISWYLQQITILSPLIWKTFLNEPLPIT